MRAMVQQGNALSWEQVPTPAPGPGEVRIRVRAAGVNRADLAQRAGLYPPPPGASPILGMEVAGEIDAVGEGTHWQVGQPACALLAGGGYAQAAIVPEGHLLPIPRDMTMTEAASLPEAVITAWLNVYGEAAAQPGERVLLHAGASGVGTIAIQICKALGNPVWVTAGSDDKIARCVALGAEGGANRKAGPWAPLADIWTGGQGLDVILDPVGGGYLDANLQSLAIGGRLVIIGLMGGREAKLDIGRLMVKRLRVIGSVLRSRSPAEKAAIIARVEEKVWPLVESRRIVPVIDRVFPITEVDAAHVHMASDASFGKIVLAL
jgi:putative PIG3 family NAD(P)H quinone oxidoreductase